MIAVMRLVLAASALLIIYIDPFEPERYVALTYSLLAFYIAYCLILYGLVWTQSPLLPVTTVHWLDVMWYAVLVGLSGGTYSIFFFFFFFAILVASFLEGFASGLRVTLASVVIFIIVGRVMMTTEVAFELNRFLLRPTYLLVLGYMIAYWGGAEIELKRRLALLKDVSALANPRFGVDRTLGAMMQRLRVFYDAEACLLVTPDPITGGYSLRRTDRRNLEAMGRAEPIDEDLARILLALPAERALVYGGASPPRSWWRLAAGAPPGKVTTNRDSAETAQARGVLGAESFVTVPFRARDTTVGRLYLTFLRRRAFNTTEVDFLVQVLDHVVPVLDNIRLVDRLASDAAETERQRIARDLHDRSSSPTSGCRWDWPLYGKSWPPAAPTCGMTWKDCSG
jgi:signal transduction histidine kinase